jgi:drug/metabolite transporter (DMT)-like permease
LTRRGWILFAALSVIWGIPYLLIKVAVTGISPALLVFARSVIGCLLLLPMVVHRRQLRLLLPHWRAIALFTIAELAIPWVLLFDAERRLSSSLTGLLVACVPLAGAALWRLSGSRERLGGPRLVGLLIGLAGVLVLLGLDVRAGDAGAIAEMVFVVLGYAAGPIIVARQLTDVPSLEVVAVALGVSAIGYAPIALAQLPAAMPAATVISAVLVLGVVCTALAFLVFFQLIAEVGPVRSTVITYVNPAVAIAAGVAFLDEPFTFGTAAGFALILLGSLLATHTGSRAHSDEGASESATVTSWRKDL